MTIVLDDRAVKESFDWLRAFEALRQAYSGDVRASRYPERSMARGERSWLRTLTGISADGLMGAKLIAADLDGPSASYLIPLFNERTAQLVALIDGQSITGYRTAATSALAADILTPPGPLKVGVIGTGFEAQHHVTALASARELSEVRVWSPRLESRQRFVTKLADSSSQLVPASDAEDAVRQADLIICASRSRDESPTLLGSWVRAGATVVSVGSTLPEQREVDVDLLARADMVVADMVDEVLHDTGDVIAATAAGIDIGPKTISLGDLISGRKPGRKTPDQIVVYKSVGSAVQDLAVAIMCLRYAESAGLGVPLPVEIPPVRK